MCYIVYLLVGIFFSVITFILYLLNLVYIVQLILMVLILVINESYSINYSYWQAASLY